MDVEPLLLLLIPILINIGFFKLKLIKVLSILSALLTILISLSLYFLTPIITTFFLITKFTTFFLLMITSIYLLSTLYSINYIKPSRIVSERLYYILLNSFVTSMIFTVIVNNYGLMWVGIELTTVTSALLIVAEASETSLEATWRYIIIVSAGVTLALFSIILIYYNYHTLTITEITPENNIITRLAVALALIGFGTKAGVFPMYTWLPDAHSEAPSPISALFSGVLLPAAAYVLYMVYLINPLINIFVIFSTLSIITTSIILLNQWHIKRMFAYSTIENMNLALLGLVLGQPLGAIILLLSHAFGKAGAFYSSGIIVKILEEKRIENIDGLYSKLKLTSASLLMSSLAVTGTPPFATFIGEFLILQTLIQKGYTIEFVLILASLATAFISINYNITKIIFTQKGINQANLKEPTLITFISLISSIIPLILGILLLVILP
ncbi:proton-conducting transporter membrane subunit [Sulfolobus sp. E11-6]|uniref:proton-conducting transporter transmembrane domain-containing protein n=1 Tax=Sulfolobus sp. E11-6 TaxID=2663020 RepID=UPI0012961104|nr:proton-conducting transporter membrane subunit [Sulfolobus sp. E11-6]QGA69354.1 hydrogenase 4 subunit F [Sulfolobus sp. E11-6]